MEDEGMKKKIAAGNQERVATTTGCVLNQRHRQGDREAKIQRDEAKQVKESGGEQDREREREREGETQCKSVQPEM